MGKLSLPSMMASEHRPRTSGKCYSWPLSVVIRITYFSSTELVFDCAEFLPELIVEFVPVMEA